MRKAGILGILTVFVLAMLMSMGCGRGTIKTRNHWAGDRNVSSWHKGKRKIKARKRAYKGTQHNRAPINR